MTYRRRHASCPYCKLKPLITIQECSDRIPNVEYIRHENCPYCGEIIEVFMREYLGNQRQFQRAIYLRIHTTTEDDELRKRQRIIKLSGGDLHVDKRRHTQKKEPQLEEKIDRTTNVFNIDLFNKRMKSFPKRYMDNFDYFWKWKLEKEYEKQNIFNKYALTETHFRLAKILNRWQTYRNGDNLDSIGTLRDSLGNIAEAYHSIKNFTLLDFNEIPREPLDNLWNELGRVKERNGSRNEYGSYSIIAICKPLLLLWGQTLAFDSKVRKNIDKGFQIPKYSGKWILDDWIKGMENISEVLNEAPGFITTIQDESYRKYGKNAPVPYGRFLDIYYFEGE